MEEFSEENASDNDDLPEDRSTVLLLGVTRLPTSPVPARRPSTLPLGEAVAASAGRPSLVSTAEARRSSFTARRHLVIRRTSSAAAPNKKRTDPPPPSASNNSRLWSEGPRGDGGFSTPPSSATNNNIFGYENVIATPAAALGTVMDRSVDSIGTCSLDVEASADLSDWSEASSGGTLRSGSFKTPSSEHHLPSYLSLACTVNGYSATTNYDPERLARSRDASPHRPHNADGLTTPKTFPPTYSIQNNLLSPPNLVPLPIHVKKKQTKKNKIVMADHALAPHQQQQHHQDFYRSSKTMTFQESHFQQHSSSIFSATTSSPGKDSVDACFENGGLRSHVMTSYESKTLTSTASENRQTTKFTSSEISKEFSNGTGDGKSFIQQRVERLYGPGALAQGFFVMKRQKSRGSESENEDSKENNKPVESTNGESSLVMKTSTSSPTLPVLRHLRPEFRAQLPFVSPRKSAEGTAMQKSSTEPTLKDQVKVNGQMQGASSEGSALVQSVIAEESGEKDGHYFLKVLQREADRLLKKADLIENELENPDLSEEVVGKIRSATGKARLLVSQKMQQFKGLCTNNLTQAEGEAYPTTNEDLQGFWDMVMLQVDQVDNIFKEMDALKANNWQEIEVEEQKKAVNGNNKKKVVNRARPTSAASEEARKQREAQRKQMIEERRKAMKAKSAKSVENIEIFVPESS